MLADLSCIITFVFVLYNIFGAMKIAIFLIAHKTKKNRVHSIEHSAFEFNAAIAA